MELSETDLYNLDMVLARAIIAGVTHLQQRPGVPLQFFCGQDSDTTHYEEARTRRNGAYQVIVDGFTAYLGESDRWNPLGDARPSPEREERQERFDRGFTALHALFTTLWY